MIKIQIKEIKGNNYLYLSESSKVNSKSLPILLYVGRIDKIDINTFLDKLHEFTALKLKKILDYRVAHYPAVFLDKENITSLETLRFYYAEFREIYPDEGIRYVDSVFVRYVQGTTAIEGNTISPQEAQELLDHDISPAGKKVSEVYEILNFVRLRDFLLTYAGDISEKLIKTMHSLLMENLMRTPGDYRQIQVGIEKVDYEPPPAIFVPEMMKDLIVWYRKEAKSRHPFELAVELHTRFELIHPFPDGNGRVGRALMNQVLERVGYPALYLGLPHRLQYLDAIKPANDGNLEPIIAMLYSIYVDQHEQVVGQVRQKMGEGSLKLEAEALMKEFGMVKKKWG
jgi:fido (protein-threonine AMPylation protein)